MKKTKTVEKETSKASQPLQEQDQAQPLASREPRALNLAEIMKDEPVYANSLAAALLGLDRGSILREIQYARQGILKFYMSAEGGNHTAEEAVRLVDHFPEDPEKTLKFLMSQPVTAISWYGLEKLYSHDPKLTKQIWRLICEEAAQDLRHGHRMAKNFEVTDWQRDPWIRAQFLAIRNGFIEEWKPRGGIELALIDTMAQAYSEYLHWVQETHRRSTTEVKYLSAREEELFRQTQGHWVPPRVGEQAAIEHAAQMMDRYNRLLLRTLRQLRDLRRYSPVTINNPQQVNIAADGGQQVNAVQIREEERAKSDLLTNGRIS